METNEVKVNEEAVENTTEEVVETVGCTGKKIRNVALGIGAAGGAAVLIWKRWLGPKVAKFKEKREYIDISNESEDETTREQDIVSEDDDED